MAKDDEAQIDEAPEDGADDAPVTEGGEESEGADRNEIDAGEGSGGDDDEVEGASSLPLLEDLAIAVANDTLGELTLHFPSRDVVLLVDGRAAATAMDLFSRRKTRPPEPFIPGRSSMRNSWFAADLNEALALSWWPGLPSRPARTVIDPVAPLRP
jgi:hypothetical protein